MSNLKPLELEKWVPRPPSPRLHKHIFGQEPANDMVFHLRDLSRWIVPAFGCFLLMMGSLSSHFPSFYSLTNNNFVLPPLSEESSVAMLPGGRNHSGVNSYPAKSYELSFGTRASTAAATTASSILISYTNKLIQ